MSSSSFFLTPITAAFSSAFQIKFNPNSISSMTAFSLNLLWYFSLNPFTNRNASFGIQRVFSSITGDIFAVFVEKYQINELNSLRLVQSLLIYLVLTSTAWSADSSICVFGRFLVFQIIQEKSRMTLQISNLMDFLLEYCQILELHNEINQQTYVIYIKE